MTFLKRIKFSEATPENEARPPSGPRLAGNVLRLRREQLGLSLEEAGGALRIRPAYLAALEEGRPDRLPGSAYAVGFLRGYADHLGLDSVEVLRRFKAESAGLDTKPDLAFPMPLGERGVPGGGALLVALILVACGYGAWYYVSTGERLRPQRVGELPAALMPPKPPAATPAPARATPPAATPADAPQTAALPPAVPSPAPPAAPAPSSSPNSAPTALPTAPAAAVTPAASASTVPSPGVLPPAVAPPAVAPPAVAPPAVAPPSVTTRAAATATVPAPAAPPPAAGIAAAAAPAAAKPPSAAKPAASPAASHILIRATADSWISVHDAAGTPVFTRTLKAGESYPVPDKPGLTMDTGNAGGLSLTLDGKPLPSLGGEGVVRRHIALDAHALAAEKPSPSAAEKPKTD